jgi:hypothetical protein
MEPPPARGPHATAPPYPCPVAKIRQARRCRAHRRDGRPCRCYAVTGAFVCRMHGGAAGQVKRKARERVVEQSARRLLAAWAASPAYQDYQDAAALAGDRPAIETLAERLG